MEENSHKINRRDVIKGLAAIPVLGGFFLAAASKSSYDNEIRNEILNELKIEPATPMPTGSMAGDAIRVGIIGYGGRGADLIRAIGFAAPNWIEDRKKDALENPKDTRLKDFMEQEDLNLKLTAVCDTFDVRAELGAAAGTVDGAKPKMYRDYRKMLEDNEIDAVVIATPDHNHAPIAIAAIQAGKQVYVEKCMTHKVSETNDLYDAVVNSNIVFQLGHQHRQTASFLTARELINKKVLGHINLIQTNTNRNDDNGAWQWGIHEKGNLQTIDWDLFLGNAPKIPFNPEHYFRWRKWWAYGTGLSGDLLTHDYDRINCVLNMGIPATCSASGGIYTHNDGRDVPDVMQVLMEYPEFTTGATQEPGKEKGMTFVYSATLGNQFDRPTLLMGHDATLQLGEQLFINADPQSTRYKGLIEKGVVNMEVPMYAYDPRAKGVDAVTGATAKYFANKGLMYTYRDGKRVDSTHLHLREWLSAIRHGHKTSCGIEEGYQEAISAHMASASVRTGRRIGWDAEARRLTNVEDSRLEELGIL
jgi:predicted dehydrogenase